MTQYAYSFNEEEFRGRYDSEQEAIEAALEDEPYADYVFIGKVIPVSAADFISPYNIIEGFQEAAGDECGEYAEDWLDDLLKNKKALTEFELYIAEWVQERYPPKFYKIDGSEGVSL